MIITGIVFLVIWIAAATLASLDAFKRTSAGCLWMLLFYIPGLGLLAVAYYAYGRYFGYNQRTLQERLMEDNSLSPDIARRFAYDIDKARYLEMADKGGGTLYEPGAPVRDRRGARRFTDRRAEALIEGRRTEEALAYLFEMYATAREMNDHAASETYRSYIMDLPDGPRLLSEFGGEGAPAQGAARNEPEVPF